MRPNRLLKGFEVELFTGRPDGRNVGIAARAQRELEGFVTEPDHRNLEYVTDPEANYDAIAEALLIMSPALFPPDRLPTPATVPDLESGVPILLVVSITHLSAPCVNRMFLAYVVVVGVSPLTIPMSVPTVSLLMFI